MMWWFLVCGLPILTFGIAALNAITWRRGEVFPNALPNTADARRISVLIPARNEARNIRQAVMSVLESPLESRVAEVLVYDDNSVDETARIVRELSARHPTVRLISGRALPADWIGKPHALEQLRRAAGSELLLFMDADVRLKPEGLPRLTSLLGGQVGGRIVTAVPEQESVTFFERLVIPLLLLTYIAWLPLRLVEKGKSPRTVAANGQLMLMSRDDLDALGGFLPIRDQIVDDMAFCRFAKQQGYRVVFADGLLMATCRMYRGARETIAGFSKNLCEGVGGPRALFAVSALYVHTFLFPYFALVAALWFQDLRSFLLLPALVAVVLLVGLRLLLCLRYRQPYQGLLDHPLSIVAFVLIAARSVAWQWSGRVTWAGRSYTSSGTRRLIREELL